MFEALFDPPVLALLIPVLVIVAIIVRMILRHRERMAIIEQGLDPDLRARERR